MNRHCKLSDVAKDYLSTFNCIFDDMMRGMKEAKLTDSISHNFIAQMIPHHMAAIEMSRNILRYTTNVPLQKIAQNIVSEQTKSIDNMRLAESGCASLQNSERDVKLYQRRADQIMRTMFAEMLSASATNNINADFIREMIPHHRGAIEMSKNALQYEICPELKPILEAIIKSQEKGIMQMRRLLSCLR